MARTARFTVTRATLTGKGLSLGVVQAGPTPILVESNPLESIYLVADPQKNFVVLMKGGK